MRSSPSSGTRPERGNRACVVRIVTRLNVGGPARHVSWLTAGVKAAGLKSMLVTGTVPQGEDDMAYFARAQGVRPFKLPALRREISWRDVPVIWRLYRLFRRMRPDVVHTHTAKAGCVGRVAGLFYRWLTPASLAGRPRPCRFVHTYHGHIFHGYYGPLKTRMFLAVERLLARLATDRIIAISPQQYREIHGTYGVGRADQFAVIPLGLDVSLFSDWRRRRHVLRDELGANEDDLLVGIIGRLTEVKNHRLFLLAAADYKKAHAGRNGARVRFVVIGDGHLRHRLEEQARSLDLSGDVTAFNHGLARLVQDPALRRALGEHGRVFVEQNYSRDRLIKDILSLYDELLEPRCLTSPRRAEPSPASATGT